MTNATSYRQRALITGASSGIGAGFARHLARADYDVVLVARRKEELEQLAAELEGAHGIGAEVIAADLAAGEGVSAVERRLSRGEVDLLVNNAGFGTYGEFSALAIEREIQEIDVNVRALVRLSHAALQSMTARRAGAIINVASTAAFQPVPYNATYAATKAFVLHFSEALHEELRSCGVVVTCLCPGPVPTEFQEVAGIDPARVPAISWTSVDAVVEAALSGVRRRRAIVIPGAVNRFTATAASLGPRFVVRRLAGTMFKRAGRAPSV